MQKEQKYFGKKIIHSKTMTLVVGVKKSLAHKSFVTEMTPVRSLSSVVALVYNKS
jgi:hypothetical protein